MHFFSKLGILGAEREREKERKVGKLADWLVDSNQMIAPVGHQRVFIRSLIYKPPSAFQLMAQLPQVLETSFSLCPLPRSSC